MKNLLLGFRVRAFVPGEGWREDRFELKQAAIECAERAGGGAHVDRITQWSGDPEEFENVWPPAE